MSERESPNAQSTQALEYIQAMLGQLRLMAEDHRLDMLSYMIELAYIEANDIRRGERPARIMADVEGKDRPRLRAGRGH